MYNCFANGIVYVQLFLLMGLNGVITFSVCLVSVCVQLFCKWGKKVMVLTHCVYVYIVSTCTCIYSCFAGVKKSITMHSSGGFILHAIFTQNKVVVMIWRLLVTCSCTSFVVTFPGKVWRQTRSRRDTRRLGIQRDQHPSRCSAKTSQVS